jgi:sarcosine oxidase subunit gamma
MHEKVLDRPLPLKMHMRQGRYGAPYPAGSGLRLSVRHPLSIATVIARKDQGKALSAAFEAHYRVAPPPPGRTAKGHGLMLQWCGAEQYFAIAEGRSEGVFYLELKARLMGLASVSDQSHGRVVITVAGAKAPALLAKGSPVDFHPREFPVGAAAVTQMAHIGVHVSRTEEDRYELSLFSGFSEYFWEWLTEQAQEFGYEVD